MIAVNAIVAATLLMGQYGDDDSARYGRRPVPRHYGHRYEANEYVSVTIRGVLRTGVVAIGSETTGTEVSSRGMTFELDFGGNPGLQRAAERMHGSSVVVTGSLNSRRGVEVPRRWIVRVTSLRPTFEWHARQHYPDYYRR